MKRIFATVDVQYKVEIMVPDAVVDMLKSTDTITKSQVLQMIQGYACAKAPTEKIINKSLSSVYRNEDKDFQSFFQT